MDNTKISPKKTVSIVFIALIALTVIISAAIVVEDIIKVRSGYYTRDGFEGLFYYAMFMIMIYAVIFELNLWFDIRYFASERDKKRPYKTIFHIISLELIIPLSVTVSALVLMPTYSFFLEILTYVLGVSHIVTRLAHLIVYLVMHGKEKRIIIFQRR
ncbi:MAG: hypothetical protein IKP68_09175 [Clostridia bacterium]|nr:hypothetical protein [Clostridia bacterium]